VSRREHTRLPTPHGVDLEVLAVGAGEPVTVFAHGLAGSIPDTRPYGSAVPGTRVFFCFRGHGSSSTPPDGWTYADLADDLRAVVRAYGASQALGVSMGAGALCRAVADQPDLLRRLVFVLPAVLDERREPAALDRLAGLAAAVESGDRDRIAARVTEIEIPPAAAGTPTAAAVVRQRVDALLGTGVGTALRRMPAMTALDGVPDPAAALGRVTASALVIGCEGDPMHPAGIARRLAALLPSATLHVYPDPDPLWLSRGDLRARIAAALGSG
jgi:pimeloyl-ACP methyl ester carboxylesterase